MEQNLHHKAEKVKSEIKTMLDLKSRIRFLGHLPKEIPKHIS